MGRHSRYLAPDPATGAVECLRQKEYGVQVVVTNVSSARAKLQVLTQVPHGAVPLAGTVETRGRQCVLGPYATQTLEYRFYFPSPAPGGARYRHYPVHVSAAEALVAFAPARAVRVVAELGAVDATSPSKI